MKILNPLRPKRENPLIQPLFQQNLNLLLFESLLYLHSNPFPPYSLVYGNLSIHFDILIRNVEFIPVFFNFCLFISRPINIRILGFSLINIIIEMAGEYINLCPQLIKIIQVWEDFPSFWSFYYRQPFVNILLSTVRLMISNSCPSLFVWFTTSFKLVSFISRSNWRCSLSLFTYVIWTGILLFFFFIPSASTNPAQKELILESLLDFFREPSLILDLYTNVFPSFSCINAIVWLRCSMHESLWTIVPFSDQHCHSLFILHKFQFF